MSKAYQNVLNTKVTPQNLPIPGREAEMAPNNAGGHTFTLDKWGQLDRFLVLGSEGGTYYQSEQALTLDNAKNLKACVEEDGRRVVERATEISVGGRAPKNDPAIFALAVSCSFGDEGTRRAAYSALPQVCRIGTHLFTFCSYTSSMRGWGKGLRKAVQRWYSERNSDQITYQLVKYRQRNGWSHRDTLRLAHVSDPDESKNAAYRWATGQPLAAREVTRKLTGKVSTYPSVEGHLPKLIQGFERAQVSTDEKELVSLIQEYGLPWEALPTEALKSARVWETLLPTLPLTALVRNLGRLTSLGIIAPLSEGAKLVQGKLADGDHLRKSRVHPMAVLIAAKQYGAGKGLKGSLTWTPNQGVLDALDAAFYLAFGNVPSTGKNLLLALDVSGSMSIPVSGASNLTCIEAVAALALITANVESNYHMIAFSNKGKSFFGNPEGRYAAYGGTYANRDGVSEVEISPKMRLDKVVSYMARDLGAGMTGTDCSLPMTWANEKNVPVDGFCIYTDNETWAGKIQPAQALVQYRKNQQRDSKLVVCAMTATKFSIADPQDPGMLDVVGFDAGTPQVISSFISPEVSIPPDAVEEAE
jgi:60 kDa SS-A/Ro ribonucleoprotein